MRLFTTFGDTLVEEGRDRAKMIDAFYKRNGQPELYLTTEQFEKAEPADLAGAIYAVRGKGGAYNSVRKVVAGWFYGYDVSIEAEFTSEEFRKQETCICADPDDSTGRSAQFLLTHGERPTEPNNRLELPYDEPTISLRVIGAPSELRVELNGVLYNAYSENGVFVFEDGYKKELKLNCMGVAAIGQANRRLNTIQNMKTLNMSRIDRLCLVFDKPLNPKRGYIVEQVVCRGTTDYGDGVIPRSKLGTLIHDITHRTMRTKEATTDWREAQTTDTVDSFVKASY